MADITYKRTFAHTDWIDGKSIVQAEGSDGVNGRFHGCEAEFDTISTTFGSVNTAIKNALQLQLVTVPPNVSIAPKTTSPEFDIETYDRGSLPTNIEKIYYCVIFPTAGLTILHNFLYHSVQGNRTRVTICFFNPSDTAVSFGYRIMSLGGPTT